MKPREQFRELYGARAVRQVESLGRRIRRLGGDPLAAELEAMQYVAAAHQVGLPPRAHLRRLVGGGQGQGVAVRAREILSVPAPMSPMWEYFTDYTREAVQAAIVRFRLGAIDSVELRQVFTTARKLRENARVTDDWRGNRAPLDRDGDQPWALWQSRDLAGAFEHYRNVCGEVWRLHDRLAEYVASRPGPRSDQDVILDEPTVDEVKAQAISV